MATHSIVGEWRGHYQYPKFPELSGAFTAFFLEKSGHLEASIIDDQWPGKATAVGSFTYPNIRFTKTYVNQSKTKIEGQIGSARVELTATTAPIDYEGRMDEDGKSMNGTWIIKSPSLSSGTWTAYRVDEAEADKHEEADKRIKQPQLDELLL